MYSLNLRPKRLGDGGRRDGRLQKSFARSCQSFQKENAWFEPWSLRWLNPCDPQLIQRAQCDLIRSKGRKYLYLFEFFLVNLKYLWTKNFDGATAPRFSQPAALHLMRSTQTVLNINCRYYVHPTPPEISKRYLQIALSYGSAGTSIAKCWISMYITGKQQPDGKFFFIIIVGI